MDIAARKGHLKSAIGTMLLLVAVAAAGKGFSPRPITPEVERKVSLTGIPQRYGFEIARPAQIDTVLGLPREKTIFFKWTRVPPPQGRLPPRNRIDSMFKEIHDSTGIGLIPSREGWVKHHFEGRFRLGGKEVPVNEFRPSVPVSRRQSPVMEWIGRRRK
ncbi:MAG: hypothetical protein AABX01_04445 [Candidatus Micrarchaeota archaeon]